MTRYLLTSDIDGARQLGQLRRRQTGALPPAMTFREGASAIAVRITTTIAEDDFTQHAATVLTSTGEGAKKLIRNVSGFEIAATVSEPVDAIAYWCGGNLGYCVDEGVAVTGPPDCFGCNPHKVVPEEFVATLDSPITLDIPASGTETWSTFSSSPNVQERNDYTQTWTLPTLQTSQTLTRIGTGTHGGGNPLVDCPCRWGAVTGDIHHRFYQQGPGCRYLENVTGGPCALIGSGRAFPTTVSTAGTTTAEVETGCFGVLRTLQLFEHLHTNCNQSVANPHNSFSVTDFCTFDHLGMVWLLQSTGTHWSVIVRLNRLVAYTWYTYFTAQNCPLTPSSYADFRLGLTIAANSVIQGAQYETELSEVTLCEYTKLIDCSTDFSGQPITLTRVGNASVGFATFPNTLTIEVNDE